MNLPMSAVVVLLLMTTLSATALIDEISLTCPDTAQRKLEDISKIYNCTPSLVPEEDVAICRGYLSEYFLIKHYEYRINLKFKMLEEIPDGTAICLGLRSIYVYVIVDDSDRTPGMEYSFDFNPLLAVGIMTTDDDTSKTTRAYSISLLSYILNLSQFEPYISNFWDFSNFLLGTQLNWIESFDLRGEVELIDLMWLEKLQNTNIQSLKVSYMPQQDHETALVTGMPVLREMIFDGVSFKEFHQDSFLGMPEMEVLILKNTDLSGIPQMIDRMPKLKILEISKSIRERKANFTIPTKELSTLTNLQVLNLTKNNIYSISEKLPPLPKLRILNLDDCSLDGIDKSDLIGYPMLEELILSNNMLTHIEANTFLSLKRLKILDLTNTNLKDWPVLHDSSLIFLNLSRNLLKYLYNFGNTGTTVEVLDISFNGIPEWEDKYVFSLQKSFISHTNHRKKVKLSHSENINQKYMTKTNPFLKILGSSVSQRAELTTPSLSGLKTELIHVNQSSVNLTDFLPNTKGSEKVIAKEFEDAHEYSYLMQPHLWVKKIDISHNLISGLSETMIHSIDGIDEIDLGGNLFNCVDCRVIPFQKWLNTTSIIVKNFGTSDPFLCWSPGRLRGTPVNLVQFDEEPCLEKIRTTSLLTLIGVPVGLMSSLVVAAAGIIYKYRAEIVYMLHLFKIRQRAKAFSKSVFNKYAFDAFICYSSQDRRFVVTRLTPLLEKGKEQYCLCLHERDFPLGSHIVSNIVGSIQHSRKTIVVLSEHFISSKWCNWELEMANHKMFNEDEHFLILIQLDTLDRNKLPRHLQFLMDTRTYLEWPSSGRKDEEEVVVARLKKALGLSIFQTTNERAPLLEDVMEEY